MLIGPTQLRKNHQVLQTSALISFKAPSYLQPAATCSSGFFPISSAPFCCTMPAPTPPCSLQTSVAHAAPTVMPPCCSFPSWHPPFLLLKDSTDATVIEVLGRWPNQDYKAAKEAADPGSDGSSTIYWHNDRLGSMKVTNRESTWERIAPNSNPDVDLSIEIVDRPCSESSNYELHNLMLDTAELTYEIAPEEAVWEVSRRGKRRLVERRRRARTDML